jgi:hypothetical protein
MPWIVFILNLLWNFQFHSFDNTFILFHSLPLNFRRVLEVLLSAKQTSSEGISALSRLQSLQKFIFSKDLRLLIFSMRRRDHLSWLMKLCFDLLPRLHVVALDPEPRMLYKSIMGMVTSKALSDLGPQQRTLQLHRLVLSGPVPEHIALPELRFLSVNWPSEPVILDADRFPRLSELDLNGVCRDELMRILRLVGRQLTALHFEVHDVVQLDGVLSECPDLSELILNVFGVHSSSELQPHTLRRLQKLRVTFADTDYDHQPHLLIKMLRLAPELCSVYLSLQTFHVEVFKSLFLLASQRSCMRHLEEFKVCMDHDKCNGYQRALLKIVLLFCTIGCEQLKIVELLFQRGSF